MVVDILIGADTVPTKSNEEDFRNGNKLQLIGKELCTIFDQSDYIILNMEAPMIDTSHPIIKCGPNIGCPMDTIAGFKAINPYFYTLANNHILDYGEDGLFLTMRLLAEQGISYSGAGKDLAEASSPFVVNIKGIKIGIYCCTDREFSMATLCSAGANPYDPLSSYEHVKRLKARTDFMIVLFHGGKEHYRYPSPNLQRIFRKFADCGADYVIAQHTHCVGCMEKYKESVLVYGQGNFIFDYDKSEFWNTSILIKVRIDISNTLKMAYECIPLIKEGSGVRMAKGTKAEEIIGGFKERSRQIAIPGFIEKQFSEFADSMLESYLIRNSGGFGHFLPVRILNKLSHYEFMRMVYNKKYIPAIENCIECEAHREVMLEALRRLYRI